MEISSFKRRFISFLVVLHLLAYRCGYDSASIGHQRSLSSLRRIIAKCIMRRRLSSIGSMISPRTTRNRINYLSTFSLLLSIYLLHCHDYKIKQSKSDFA